MVAFEAGLKNGSDIADRLPVNDRRTASDTSTVWDAAVISRRGSQLSVEKSGVESSRLLLVERGPDSVGMSVVTQSTEDGAALLEYVAGCSDDTGLVGTPEISESPEPRPISLGRH